MEEKRDEEQKTVKDREGRKGRESYMFSDMVRCLVKCCSVCCAVLLAVLCAVEL